MKTWGVWAVCVDYEEGLPVYLGEVFAEHRGQAKRKGCDLEAWKYSEMNPLKWKIIVGYPKKED